MITFLGNLIVPGDMHKQYVPYYLPGKQMARGGLDNVHSWEC